MEIENILHLILKNVTLILITWSLVSLYLDIEYYEE